MESDLTESRSPDALYKERSTAARAYASLSPHPTRTMAQLERLPTEIVSLIGDNLNPSGLAQLRLASKTMDDHLSFNVKRLFREIRCQLTLPKMEELFWLMRQPLANSVESLIWIRPLGVILDSSWDSDAFPWSIRNDNQGSVTKLFVGVWMSAAGFRNLKSIGWTSGEALQDWEYSLFDTGMAPSDISFWSAVVRKIRRPLEVRVYERKEVYWGFSWTGCKESTAVAFVRTSFPVEEIHRTEDDGCLTDWQTLSVSLGHMKHLQDKLQGYLGLLELRRTVIESYHLSSFAAANVEISESRFNDRLESHLFVFDKIPTILTKTIRNLSISNCSLEAQERSDVLDFLAGLRDYSQLQSFQFEQIRLQHLDEIGDLTFDWDNNGRHDHGARLQEFIDDLGMKMALSKAIDCIQVPEEPYIAKLAYEKEIRSSYMSIGTPPPPGYGFYNSNNSSDESDSNSDSNSDSDSDSDEGEESDSDSDSDSE